MSQTVLTFVTRVRPESVAELRALLDRIGGDVENDTLIRFKKCRLLHFASFVMHEPKNEEEKKEYGCRLVFENNFDGPLEDYLRDLYRHGSLGLHQIYSYCQDCNVSQVGDFEGLFNYLKAHLVLPNAYHIGNTGRSAERVLQEQTLKAAIETHADGLPKNDPPGKLFDALKTSVGLDPHFALLSGVGPRQTFLERYIPWVKLVLEGLLAVIAIVALLPFVLIAVFVLRHKEKTDPEQASAANSANVRELVEREDHTHNVQNHMASITIVKPGWLRRLTLWLVLWLVNLLARARSTHGELSGIPSIHFAHWSMIDNGRRLLFLSNFDGSWENYLDDFIDKAHQGLTAVWSNTEGFPRASFLINGGATDGPRFKAVARDGQVLTNVWFSAYRRLTVQNIDNSSSIREELFSPLDNKAQAAWLQRL